MENIYINKRSSFLGKEILSVSNTALELDIISQLKKLQIG
jgi:hypothetical protein